LKPSFFEKTKNKTANIRKLRNVGIKFLRKSAPMIVSIKTGRIKLNFIDKKRKIKEKGEDLKKKI